MYDKIITKKVEKTIKVQGHKPRCCSYGCRFYLRIGYLPVRCILYNLELNVVSGERCYACIEEFGGEND